MNFEYNKKAYGSIMFDDIEYALSHKPVIGHDWEFACGMSYTALAIDKNYDDELYRTQFSDDVYLVTWEITHENPKECKDESKMCDWEKPYSIKRAYV